MFNTMFLIQYNSTISIFLNPLKCRYKRSFNSGVSYPSCSIAAARREAEFITGNPSAPFVPSRALRRRLMSLRRSYGVKPGPAERGAEVTPRDRGMAIVSTNLKWYSSYAQSRADDSVARAGGLVCSADSALSNAKVECLRLFAQLTSIITKMMMQRN